MAEGEVRAGRASAEPVESLSPSVTTTSFASAKASRHGDGRREVRVHQQNILGAHSQVSVLKSQPGGSFEVNVLQLMPRVCTCSFLLQLGLSLLLVASAMGFVLLLLQLVFIAVFAGVLHEQSNTAGNSGLLRGSTVELDGFSRFRLAVSLLPCFLLLLSVISFHWAMLVDVWLDLQRTARVAAACCELSQDADGKCAWCPGCCGRTFVDTMKACLMVLLALLLLTALIVPTTDRLLAAKVGDTVPGAEWFILIPMIFLAVLYLLTVLVVPCTLQAAGIEVAAQHSFCNKVWLNCSRRAVRVAGLCWASSFTGHCPCIVSVRTLEEDAAEGMDEVLFTESGQVPEPVQHNCCTFACRYNRMQLILCALWPPAWPGHLSRCCSCPKRCGCDQHQSGLGSAWSTVWSQLSLSLCTCIVLGVCAGIGNEGFRAVAVGSDYAGDLPNLYGAWCATIPVVCCGYAAIALQPCCFRKWALCKWNEDPGSVNGNLRKIRRAARATAVLRLAQIRQPIITGLLGIAGMVTTAQEGFWAPLASTIVLLALFLLAWLSVFLRSGVLGCCERSCSERSVSDEVHDGQVAARDEGGRDRIGHANGELAGGYVLVGETAQRADHADGCCVLCLTITEHGLQGRGNECCCATCNVSKCFGAFFVLAVLSLVGLCVYASLPLHATALCMITTFSTLLWVAVVLVGLPMPLQDDTLRADRRANQKLLAMLPGWYTDGQLEQCHFGGNGNGNEDLRLPQPLDLLQDAASKLKVDAYGLGMRAGQPAGGQHEHGQRQLNDNYYGAEAIASFLHMERQLRWRFSLPVTLGAVGLFFAMIALVDLGLAGTGARFDGWADPSRPVLPRAGYTSMPLPMCTFQQGGLGVLDFGYLAMAAYVPVKPHDPLAQGNFAALQSTVSTFIPGANVTVHALRDEVVNEPLFFVATLRREAAESPTDLYKTNSSAARRRAQLMDVTPSGGIVGTVPAVNTTVLSVRGSLRGYDWAQDAMVWGMPTLWQITTSFFPPLGMLLGTEGSVELLGYLGSLENSVFRVTDDNPRAFYVSVAAQVVAISNAVRQGSNVNEEERRLSPKQQAGVRYDAVDQLGNNLAITGHSLGGGVAMISGAFADVGAVTYSGPGPVLGQAHFLQSLRSGCPECPQSKQRSPFRVGTTSLNVVPTGDVVPHLGGQPPSAQNIECNENPIACHSVVRSMCTIMQQCGDPWGRHVFKLDGPTDAPDTKLDGDCCIDGEYGANGDKCRELLRRVEDRVPQRLRRFL